MWRCLAIVAMLYALGHPGLDVYRPAAFDSSLREFHRDVNRMTAITTRAFVMFDQARALSQLNSLGVQLQAMLPGR